MSDTAAALRAATAIRGASCPHLVVMCEACAAYVIDRETGLPELLASLREIVLEWGYPNTPKWHRAKAALAKAGQ